MQELQDAGGPATPGPPAAVATDEPGNSAGGTASALSASEERFRLLAERLAGFLYDVDLSTNRVTFYAGADGVLGFLPSEAPDDIAWWLGRVHPDDTARGTDAWQAALDGDSPGYTLEFRVLHRDGHYVDVLDSGRIVRDEAGHAVRIVGGATDISERRGLEREREQLLAEVQWERSRLREIFDAAPSGVALTRGPEHVYEYVNEAYYRFAGRRDLIGRRLYDVFPEGRRQQFPAIRERVLREGITFEEREVPLAVHGPDGRFQEERYLDLTYLPVTEPEGTRSGIIQHVVDITAHVRARREIERLLAETERMAEAERSARAAAEASARSRDEVLAIVSHDLRSPLAIIAMAAHALMDDTAPPLPAARAATLLGAIQHSAEAMSRLVRDLLDVASIEAGQLAIEVRDSDAAGIVAQAADLFADAAIAHGIALETRVDPDLPAVRADAERLLQALANLMANALKFTPRGGRVTLRAERDPAGVCFAVEDTGSGIPREELAHVFDRFWQKRRGSARHGTGLGLAIVRGIVEAHGGRVGVASTPGAGSRFSVTIPAAH